MKLNNRNTNFFLKDYPYSELSSVLPSGERGKTQLDALGLDFPYSHPVGLYEELVLVGYT